MHDRAKQRDRFPRWLLVTCVFSVLLAALSSVEGIAREYPLKALIEHLLPHAIWVVTAVIVGAILIMIGEEVVERNILPLISEGFEDLEHKLGSAIKAPVDGITATLKDGFSNIATSLAAEVHRFPETWELLFRGKLIAQVTNPQAQELAKEGRIGDAITSLDDLVKDKNRVEEQIALYNLSAEEKDWATALDLIKQHGVRNPGFHVTLAFRYWSIGKLREAINIAKTALAVALEEGNQEQAARAKNSLAYYLAETDDVAYENIARQYVCEAKKLRPSAAVLDTEGFVKITYGKTKQEIMDGVGICEHARDMGAPFEAYTNHISKANKRLKQLQQAAPQHTS